MDPSAQPSASTSQRKLPATEADIKRMLATKDFYQILDVSKTATDDEIKRQYKKLALRFHPDKLRLPGAQEVFKKIAAAYDCLSNPDKRAYYDRTGSDQPQQQRAYEQQYYEYEDFDPSDIFSSFFPGFQFQQGGQRRHHYQYRARPNRGEQGERQQQGGSFMGLLQLLPFLLILFSGFFNQLLFAETPEFSLHKTQTFGIQKKSMFLNINYFVDSSFEDNVMEDIDYLPNFEWKVEQEYINNIKINCSNQQSKKRQYANQARMSWSKRDQNYYQQQSDRVDMSPCIELDDFNEKFDINKYF